MASNVLPRTSAAAAPRLSSAALTARSAVLTGVAAFVYAIAFVVLDSDGLAAAMLALVGFLTIALFAGLYDHLAAVDAAFGRLALALGLLGGSGALIHGGYDLANALHPPATPNLDLPSAIDPRGLLTFGAGGVALLLVALLLGRAPAFPRGLVALGYLAAALALILYFGRLIILDAKHLLIVVAAVLSGFLVSPAWNIWLGLTLLRERPR